MFFINSEFFQLCLTFRYFGWLDFSTLKVSWQLWDKKLPEVTKAGLWTVWFVKIWWQDLLKRIFMTLHQREYTFMVCIFPIIKFVKKWNYTFCRIQKQQAQILEGEVFSVSWSISKVFFFAYRTVFGRCQLGQKDWKTGGVQTQSLVWANASNLHLCYQHNSWQRFQIIWVPNLQKTSPNRFELHWIYRFWKWYWTQALDHERRSFTLWHQIKRQISTINNHT